MNTAEMSADQVQKIVDRYNKHLKTCRDYKKAHPEKNNAYSNKYFKTMKDSDPDKYDAYLAKQKKYYNEVAKPRNLAAKIVSIELFSDISQK